jgi:hypothetical protein
VRVRRCCCPRGRGSGGEGGSVGRRERSEGKLQLRRVIGPLRGRRLNFAIPSCGWRRGRQIRFRGDRHQREFAILHAGNQRISAYSGRDCENGEAREQRVFEASGPGNNLPLGVRRRFGSLERLLRRFNKTARRQTEPAEAPQKVPFLAFTFAFAPRRQRNLGGLRKASATTFVSHRLHR